MIGIIGAMDEEVAMLKEKLTEVQVETKAAMDFYKGKLEGKDVVVVRSGIGKVNAAMCAQILADEPGAKSTVWRNGAEAGCHCLRIFRAADGKLKQSGMDKQYEQK